MLRYNRERPARTEARPDDPRELKENISMSFQSLGLAEPITRAVAEERYTVPTPIQARAIPPILSGRDLIGIAQTGTGKTAAFALPILHRLVAKPAQREPKSVGVLVLTPTRELASQIVDNFQTYGRHLRTSVRLAIGGVPIGRQIRSLSAGADVLVATPGRLIDLDRSRAVRLDQVACLVVDEADRMFDMGFLRDVERIVAMLPKQRQTLLFSATMPPEIARLAARMLVDPAEVAVTPVASTVERIEQQIAYVKRADKLALLGEMLKREPIDRALVFTRTKHGADRVVRGLNKAGISAQAIHGNKSQNQRERVLAGFRQGRIRTLVATDIAARGIDVDGISHVFNFDLPEVAETYVHRIGRTARAGRAGVAVSLCAAEEQPLLAAIEKLIRQDISVVHGERSTPPARPGKSRPAGRDVKRRSNGGGRRRHGGRGRIDSGRDSGEISTVAFLRKPRGRRNSGAGGPVANAE
jgi:ATP-dependent RNA helicase RhlE